jgi:hypothetical protein
MTSVRQTALPPTLLKGGSDPKGKQDSAGGGMRGEPNGNGYERSSAKGLRVEETSGVAYAEATSVPRGPFPDVRQGDGSPLRWLIVAAAIGFTFGLKLRPQDRSYPIIY